MNKTHESFHKQQRGLETRATLLESAGIVFSQMKYDKAKLRFISEQAGISLGSLYFHFGNKDDIAAAVLDAQQEAMTGVLSEVVQTETPHLEQLLTLLERMATLIATNTIVQAGISLVQSLPDELRNRGYTSYEEWQTVTETMIQTGQEDGSITTIASATELAEVINELFVGAQVMAGMKDNWVSLPDRIKRARPHITQFLSPEHSQI
ncbi:TetR/AcrR family transcriptional regulator [Leucobacter chinensis]|uniref:TetR/AcrR family transcriptional regulator n=1 Tax=Leucobacter chinensis TaxID=2851010 RepID=UPI001C24CC3F|nr:TetR/AcrR family transcriptional regulator [Leucobacter chinensis]